jgi:hypothetical protein
MVSSVSAGVTEPIRVGFGGSCVASAELAAVHAADEQALLTPAPSPAPASG